MNLALFDFDGTITSNEMLQMADIKYFRWKAVSHLSKSGRWEIIDKNDTQKNK